ncbi:MAG: hypothetical protein B6245_15795 [Desulfobacteraceae bacterium 4572_88]|nr:MAG: hypothetical protein B6245_15795 [Desulfobacteraceae bacterium 4572_88]
MLKYINFWRNVARFLINTIITCQSGIDKPRAFALLVLVPKLRLGNPVSERASRAFHAGCNGKPEALPFDKLRARMLPYAGR